VKRRKQSSDRRWIARLEQGKPVPRFAIENSRHLLAKLKRHGPLQLHPVMDAVVKQ
jgi:hypothetical protein